MELKATATNCVAPGAPGTTPNWCHGNKQAVGTTLGPSRVWFTIGQGILNEVYYPRVDIPQIRDLGFIVTDGHGFWVELKGMADCSVSYALAGVPAITIVHEHERFTFTQRIVPEPNRDVILISIELSGDDDLYPCVLLAPHLGGTGHDNMAAVGEHRGRTILWAEQGPFGLALAALDEHQKVAFGKCSAGYSGVSDGWQDFDQHGAMCWTWPEAGPGNVALSAELTRSAVLGLGFSTSRTAAATLAVSALLQPFDTIWQQQIHQWQQWHSGFVFSPDPCMSEKLGPGVIDQLKTSAMVLRTHQDQNFRGTMVASLSIPWGETGEERPGYHLVWPRDLVECAGALLAMGAEVEAREILRYLMATQRKDGSWYQNQWLGGTPFWRGIQLDEIAFPVLLAGTLADRDALDGVDVTDMASRALGFILRHGPLSHQDRWEENAGINTFTLSVCIAALVSGARFLPTAAEGLVLEVADYWNSRLEDWTTVHDTELARQYDVEGYYIRITPPSAMTDDTSLSRTSEVKNRRGDPGLTAAEQIGVDFLQLVRYGLRTPDQPLIKDTLKLVDALLRVDLPQGPSWHRYREDGYGEHRDGASFDGVGIGRAWPLLTGERGHFELAAGNDAMNYLRAMLAMAGPAGMLPEQVWDDADNEARRLYTGRPTGSAMPLAWAHAEFIKLACSILTGHPVDRPEPVWSRYRGRRPQTWVWYWSPQAPVHHLPNGMRLGFCLPHAARIRWTLDDATWQRANTSEPVPGVHIVRLPAVDQASWIKFRINGEQWPDSPEHCVLIDQDT